MKLHVIAIAGLALSASAGPGFSANNWNSFGNYADSYNAVEHARCVEAKNDGDLNNQRTYCPPNEWI